MRVAAAATGLICYNKPV